MNYDEDPWEEVNPEDDSGITRNGRPSIFRWEPDRYHDKPDLTAAKIDVAEETRIRRNIQRDAIFFAVSIDNLSRTKKSAKIRKEAARWLIYKHQHPRACYRADGVQPAAALQINSAGLGGRRGSRDQARSAVWATGT